MCKLPCLSLYEMNKVLLVGFAVIIDGKAGSDGLAPFTERAVSYTHLTLPTKLEV